MKVTQDYLKQVIKEEVERMQEEGELEEGWMDAAKSLAGQAKGAVVNKAKQVGQAVGGAVKTARQASASADISPMAQKAILSVDASLKVMGDLMTRMEKLGMKEVYQLDPAVTALEQAKAALQKLAPQPKAPAPAAPAPAPKPTPGRSVINKKAQP
jgi:hypothetical protein